MGYEMPYGVWGFSMGSRMGYRGTPMGYGVPYGVPLQGIVVTLWDMGFPYGVGGVPYGVRLWDTGVVPRDIGFPIGWGLSYGI